MATMIARFPCDHDGTTSPGLRRRDVPRPPRPLRHTTPYHCGPRHHYDILRYTTTNCDILRLTWAHYYTIPLRHTTTCDHGILRPATRPTHPTTTTTTHHAHHSAPLRRHTTTTYYYDIPLRHTAAYDHGIPRHATLRPLRSRSARFPAVSHRPLRPTRLRPLQLHYGDHSDHLDYSVTMCPTIHATTTT